VMSMPSISVAGGCWGSEEEIVGPDRA